MQFPKTTFISILLILIGVESILLTLSVRELELGGVCPKMIGIPACFILFLGVLGSIISHLEIIRDRRMLFYSGTIFAFITALFASISQIIGTVECPKTLFGIPLCFVSLVSFGIVLYLKIFKQESSRRD